MIARIKSQMPFGGMRFYDRESVEQVMPDGSSQMPFGGMLFYDGAEPEELGYEAFRSQMPFGGMQFYDSA